MNLFGEKKSPQYTHLIHFALKTKYKKIFKTLKPNNIENGTMQRHLPGAIVTGWGKTATTSPSTRMIHVKGERLR